MIHVEGLTKRFGSIHALDGVSFDIHDGEILGVIGPNGSGKTTLFECIGGVLPFDAGRIDAPPQQLFYLPDAIAPWPSEPVAWALEFVSGYFGAPSGVRDAVIDTLSLQALLDKRVGHLSKGQRKRVLLAIGLLTSRQVMLADEPFDGLDLRQTREVAAALRSFTRDGRTLVLSIHQINDAARVCDRFVLLSGGTVRAQGTLAELVKLAGTSGTLEEVFLALT